MLREGTDATVVVYGPLVPVALAAANAAAEDGHSVEVIDLRSISPIDFDTVTASVKKTGRLIVAHEAPTFGGIGGEIAARISERAFLLAGGPGHPRGRLPHALPRGQGRGGLPAGHRPHP